jgi:hypothetical protein
MRTRTILILGLFLAFPASCQMARLCVKVLDGRAAHFTVEVAEPCDYFVAEADCNHCTKAASYIEEITFERVSDGAPLWRIYTVTPSADLGLGKLVYGTIPKGFEGDQATPLNPNEPIEIRLCAVGRETSILQVVPSN